MYGLNSTPTNQLDARAVGDVIALNKTVEELNTCKNLRFKNNCRRIGFILDIHLIINVSIFYLMKLLIH
jgi:hypothetical protein